MNSPGSSRQWQIYLFRQSSKYTNKPCMQPARSGIRALLILAPPYNIVSCDVLRGLYTSYVGFSCTTRKTKQNTKKTTHTPFYKVRMRPFFLAHLPTYATFDAANINANVTQADCLVGQRTELPERGPSRDNSRKLCVGFSRLRHSGQRLDTLALHGGERGPSVFCGI